MNTVDRWPIGLRVRHPVRPELLLGQGVNRVTFGGLSVTSLAVIFIRCMVPDEQIFGRSRLTYCTHYLGGRPGLTSNCADK